MFELDFKICILDFKISVCHSWVYLSQKCKHWASQAPSKQFEWSTQTPSVSFQINLVKAWAMATVAGCGRGCLVGMHDIIGLISESADNGFNVNIGIGLIWEIMPICLADKRNGLTQCAQGVLVTRSRQQCGSFLKQSFVWMMIRFTLLDRCI